MWFELILVLAFWLIIAFQGCLPVLALGREDSTFRRVPWVTFFILGVNVIVYFVCLPVVAQQDRVLDRAAKDVNVYLENNSVILADDRIRAKLREITGYRRTVDTFEEDLKADPEQQAEYKAWLRGADAAKMHIEMDHMIDALREAKDNHIFTKYGLAGAGEWQAHQFLTYAFLHANTEIGGLVFPIHLFGNLLALFAIGMTLEDLWGRGPFLLFYLAGAVVAGIPTALGSQGGPLVGASGAILATMGAFFIRLPHEKLRIAWALNPLALITIPAIVLVVMFGRKPWGIVRIKGYFYLIYYFATQLVLWFMITYRMGKVGGTSFVCHIAGFTFGAALACLVKVTKYEEKHINPRIEAKVSFSASPGVVEALELLDKGETPLAERKLKVELAKNPNDPNAMLALIQVYQRMLDFDQVNAAYARLIRYHLANHDKEAALYAYDALLTSFPDDHIDPKIPIRDWLSICDYLRESNMIREAAVEYERLVKSHPNDALTVSACVFGGEAALQVHDNSRALKLFETAEALRPGDGYASRVMNGVDNAKKRLNSRPNWVKQATKAPAGPKDHDETDVRF